LSIYLEYDICDQIGFCMLTRTSYYASSRIIFTKISCKRLIFWNWFCAIVTFYVEFFVAFRMVVVGVGVLVLFGIVIRLDKIGHVHRHFINLC